MINAEIRTSVWEVHKLFHSTDLRELYINTTLTFLEEFQECVSEWILSCIFN